MILHICDNPDVLSVMRLVKLFITIIKIAVPIILVVALMIDFMSAIKVGDEDLLKKAQQKAVKRAIAAVLIFLVPTLVGVVVKIAEGSTTSYVSCFTNATTQIIDQKYSELIDELVTIADENKSYSSYYIAKSYLSKIKDTDLKNQYSAKLDSVYEIIKSDIEEAEKEYERKDVPTPNVSSGDGLDFPAYRQCDSAWGSKSYNGTNLCNAGCGYTSLAMVLSGLNRDASITPDTVHEYIYGNGISVNSNRGEGAIQDEALRSSKVASKYGVQISVLFYRGGGESASTKKSLITSALDQGKKIVLLIPGHFVALSGTGSSIVLHDPGNISNNGTYTIDDIYNKYYNHKERCTKVGKCGFIYAVAYSK